SLELRLSSRVQSGAPTGEAQAVAQAFGSTFGSSGPCVAGSAGCTGSETVSNAAPASTRVRGDVFADEGGIVGTVNLRFTSDTHPASAGTTSTPGAPATGEPVGL